MKEIGLALLALILLLLLWNGVRFTFYPHTTCSGASYAVKYAPFDPSILRK